jgi:hypothetical protein
MDMIENRPGAFFKHAANSLFVKIGQTAGRLRFSGLLGRGLAAARRNH